MIQQVLHYLRRGVEALENVTAIAGEHDHDYAATNHTHPYLTQATADSLYAPIGGGGGGLSVSYGLVRDEKPQGTNGGSFTSGAWRTRDLNTIVHGSEFLSLSNNLLTVEAGDYVYRVDVPSFRVERNAARLRATNGEIIHYGTSNYGYYTHGAMSVSIVCGRLFLGTTTTFVVEHKSQTSRSRDGFGVASDLTAEIYTIFDIWRLS